MSGVGGLAGYPFEVRAEVDRVRQVVATLHAELPRWGLVVWTAGNVSQRVSVPGSPDLFVIKPSGVTYDELTAEAMVVCDLDGNLVDELLGVLDERSRYAVASRFGFLDGEKHSFREIGEHLGVTSEAARRLTNRALESLRGDAERLLAA